MILKARWVINPSWVKAKKLIHHVATKTISPELSEFTAEHLANIRTTPDAKEGLMSFLEKRTPKWNK